MVRYALLEVKCSFNLKWLLNMKLTGQVAILITIALKLSFRHRYNVEWKFSVLHLSA